MKGKKKLIVITAALLLTVTLIGSLVACNYNKKDNISTVNAEEGLDQAKETDKEKNTESVKKSEVSDESSKVDPKTMEALAKGNLEGIKKAAELKDSKKEKKADPKKKDAAKKNEDKKTAATSTSESNSEASTTANESSYSSPAEESSGSDQHTPEPIYESRWVVDQAAWDEKVESAHEEPDYGVYVCECGAEFITWDELEGHQNSYEDTPEEYSHSCCSNKVYYKTVYDTTTIHHDEVGHYEDVIVGYR